MAPCGPRSSVFTFESAVHSSHVLRRLDEQRRRDLLCDVTVVVEGQSYRAHRSVLASCSEYFSQRISSLAQHAAVVTLPQEVTTAGFEPLLKFAYTSKLLFGKDNVLDIRNSASVLGFRDLDEACFDFLLPKLLSSSEGSAPFQRKTCCKKKCKKGLSKDEERDTDSDHAPLDEKEVKPVADSPLQQEAAWVCNTSVNKVGGLSSSSSLTPVAVETSEFFMQCPKYRKFQLACGKESCLTEKNLNNQVTSNRNDCKLLCSTNSGGNNSKNETEFPENPTSNPSKCVADGPWKTEIPDEKTETGMFKGEADTVNEETNGKQGKWSEEEGDMDLEEDGSDGSSIKASSSGFMMHGCPLKTFGSLGHAMDCTEDKKIKETSIHCKTDEEAETEWKRGKDGELGSNGWQERGKGQNKSRQRELLVEQSSRLNFQDPNPSETVEGGGQGASSEWLPSNLSSTGASCPFFQNLEPRKCPWKGAELSECEGASQSGVSSLNSGEDGDSGTETEGDSEFYERERARQVQLPFSVDWIVDLSRNDFQQLLKQQVFTREQLDFVHDMRRRSKNRLAAQRCRKRKLDCIYNLQCEINKLKTEREKLMMEKSHLSQLKVKTCHSVSALCQRVCSEADLQPEQLQVLAKYTTPDCPLSSVFPHVDAILLQTGVPHKLQASLSACAAGPDDCSASEEASCSSGGDAVAGDGPQSL